MPSSEYRINLICYQNFPVMNWPLGETYQCPPNPSALVNCLKSNLTESFSDAWLFWDGSLGTPSISFIPSLLDQPFDIWHAGLKLGLGGKPEFIDFVMPTWMLNRDPDPKIEATSWRISLEACLIRTDVLRQLGLPDPNYQTLAACGLDLGFRFIQNGIFIRHNPNMVTQERPNAPQIPMKDQIRFLRTNFNKQWQMWSLVRATITQKMNPIKHLGDLKSIKRNDDGFHGKTYIRQILKSDEKPISNKVSVLIPTINRYPYLSTLLHQLRSQTISPLEIIIIDQTPLPHRKPELIAEYSDLPIHYFTLNQAGQCSSRNLGLKSARGEYILFIDDDDEVPADLIEQHLSSLQISRFDVSNGIAEEVGTGDQPEAFRKMRISDVFPTNNTMIKKKILTKSGLFDIAYDHGQRADHDLGMRIYINGGSAMLNPNISVLHHHAPIGGLREHKARLSTYAKSRKQIFGFNYPSVSDIYLAKRYYSPSQVKEMLWISVLGTFSIKASIWKQLLKAMVSSFLLPYTILKLWNRSRKADNLLKANPNIPTIEMNYESGINFNI